MHRGLSTLLIRMSTEKAVRRVLLCEVLDIDIGVEFRDATVRCLAHGDGSAEILDLMFAYVDAQILAEAIAVMRFDQGASSDSTECLSNDCSNRRGRRSGNAESGDADQT